MKMKVHYFKAYNWTLQHWADEIRETMTPLPSGMDAIIHRTATPEDWEAIIQQRRRDIARLEKCIGRSSRYATHSITVYLADHQIEYNPYGSIEHIPGLIGINRQGNPAQRIGWLLITLSQDAPKRVIAKIEQIARYDKPSGCYVTPCDRETLPYITSLLR